MNHTKPINKEFLEDDSNFYTAFTQYNLDEIWKSERELKYMIKVLFVCHGNNSITPKKVSIYAGSQGWRNEISTILALLK